MAKKKDRDVASLPGEITDLLDVPSEDDTSSDDEGNSEQPALDQSSNAQSTKVEQTSTAIGPLKTPAEWARDKGFFNPRNPKVPQSTDQIHPFHAAADALHGWTIDTHHYQGERAFRLGEADYDAAITAGAEYPLVAPHQPAITRSCPFDYSGFEPKKPTEKAAKRAAGAGNKSTRRANWRPFKSKR